MTQLEEIRQCTNIHMIPKSIHVLKCIRLDFRLFDALVNYDYTKDRKYDFDVYLVCIMKDSQVCTWTGIKAATADRYIETHLVPDEPQYTIDNVVYWTEIKKI